MSGDPQQEQSGSEAQETSGKEGEEGSPPSKDIEVRTPPFPLNDYTGTFTHPGYGNLVIKLTEERLHMIYPLLHLPMTYAGTDRFDVLYEPAGITVPVTYHFSPEGEVERTRMKYKEEL